ncbi:ABC transporter ATP-binding protein [Streptococcus ruminantium]|uniref:ABC transporter ATP-binding protein n=1 Tax=Streptococcus ruminantium TaxID=1917441 RepID=A0ABU1B0U4_9STRE|nr:ABC transporter ATP-binding protein [Streptococcus ruminantium]MDQ8759206.1 ABC transporter ATP-binding protein [Streptococcus ruminantium]MDQ8764257.1 ABC transporter ATP-binding protein [Streptococcus ruminantium]MDQ8769021.1 ABC transporter ATP-binding protein [Streptococcus ruminantium]MDQ8774413.1 ABC transporter ATP-binding protein [Streptococcus ruminantium]MDQ8794339.1 ABC transporter ATP-binding protein [Streptococcus ruminantium]
MRVLGFLLKQISRVKWLFAVGIGFYLLASTMVRLAPLLIQQAIDGPITDLSKGLPFDEVDFLSRSTQYVGMILIGALGFYLSMRLLMHCANRIAAALRNQAYDIMQRLPIAYFDDKPAGKIATRIVNDTETLRTQFYGTLVYVFNNIVRLGFTYGVLFYMNAILGWLMLVLIPLYVGIQAFYKKMTDKPMKDFYDARSDVNTQVNETMNGASLIQLFGQEESVMEEFEATADKMRQADNKIIWAQSLATWNLSGFLQNLVVTGILTVVGYQFLKGQAGVTAGRLFVYINYIEGVFIALGALVQQFPNLLRSFETGKRLMALLEEKVESDSNRTLMVDQGQVIFDHVYFGYEANQSVLRDISIQADKGETIALIGHTGSGKSSIMNLLYRFYDPQEGKVLIDGKNIRDYSRESLRSYMGIVLQDPYLFTGTIASNVSMNDDEADRGKILQALEKVGAGPMLARLDKGIDEPVVEKGSAFSSGERQLIAFARTLYSDPKILILDEATSHIDTETEEIIQHAMEVVKEGRTTFIIAHRLSTIQNADQILVLDQGRIVERGRHEELIGLGGIYAQMYEIQARV